MLKKRTLSLFHISNNTLAFVTNGPLSKCLSGLSSRIIQHHMSIVNVSDVHLLEM